MFGQSFSPADVTVGIIYLIRDFAQREIRHYIFIAMIIGAALSYVFASKEIAVASISGFMVGELIDWAIYTFTKRPLSKRLILSASISSPFDSAVFLAVAGRLTPVPFAMMTLGKFLGVFVLWAVWRVRSRRALEKQEAAA